MLVKEKRGAVELSITTIVIVVIGITLLTLGLKWITTTMGNISSQTDKLNKITEDQIVSIFQETEKAISTVQKEYSVKKGETLTTLEIYLRNNIFPGATHTFKYDFLILSQPPSVQASEVKSRLSWVQAPIEIISGEAYSDSVLFDTNGLPLGIYKLEAQLICLDDTACQPPESKHQFIIKVI